MDLDDAIARAPAWERLFYRVMATDPAEDLAEAIRWYEELAGTSFDPTVDLHLAILEGEADRLESVRRQVAEWSGRPDLCPISRTLLRRLPRRRAGPGGRAGPRPGSRRRARVRLVQERIVGASPPASATAKRSRRSGRPRSTVRGALTRMRVIAVQLLLLGVATAALLRLIARRGAGRVGEALLPPRWPGARVGSPGSRRSARRARARGSLRVFRLEPRAAGHAAHAQDRDQPLFRAGADPRAASSAAARRAGLPRGLRTDPGRGRRTRAGLRVSRALRSVSSARS